jgi:hypothetical protein
MKQDTKPFVIAAVMMMTISTEIRAQVADVGLVPQKLCETPTSEIQPRAVINASMDLANTIYSAQGAAASNGLFDADLDGAVTATEISRGLADPKYCEIATKPCSGKNDRLILLAARSIIASLPSDQKFSVRRLRSPASNEIDDWPALESDGQSKFSVAQMIDPEKRFVSLSCTPFEPSSEITPTTQKRHGLRISQTMAGLALSRSSSKKLREVPAATLALSNDQIKDSSSIAVDGIIGFDFARKSETVLMPLIEYRRKRVRNGTTNAPISNNNDVNTLGFGFQAAAPSGRYGQVSIVPIYVFDFVEKSEIGALKIAWKPSFLYQIDQIPFQRAVSFGPGLIKLRGQLRMDAGHIFKLGNNLDLGNKREYVRAGGDIGATIWVTALGKPFSDLTYDIDYVHLEKIAGSKSVYSIETGVTYWIGGSDNFSIGYKYKRGLNEETLDKSDSWNLNFGVRF